MSRGLHEGMVTQCSKRSGGRMCALLLALLTLRTTHTCARALSALRAVWELAGGNAQGKNGRPPIA